MTPEMKKAITERERSYRKYHASPEAAAAKCERVYANLKARMEKQKEALKEFEELKRTLAALAAQVAA